MKKLLFATTLIFFACLLSAQPPVKEIQKLNSRKMKLLDSTGWEKTGFFVFNLNQAALSDWSAGGEKFLIGVNAIVNYALHHQNGKYSFDSYVDIEIGGVEAASFKQVRKTTDRFDLTFELDHTMGKHAYYGLLFNLNTQFLGGHNYALDADNNKISGFLSPGKILLSPGIDLKSRKPNHYYSLFISPSTLKWVTKIDDEFYHQYKFGVDSAQKINTEFGAYLSAHYNIKISKTTSYIGRVDLFSNYLRNPGKVDVLMNNLLTINISNLFAANVLVDIIYDHDIRKNVQIQEIFGLGLKLKL